MIGVNGLPNISDQPTVTVITNKRSFNARMFYLPPKESPFYALSFYSKQCTVTAIYIE